MSPPDRDEANLRRLADALNELDCRLVTDPADTAAWVPLPPHYFTPRSLLAASVWNLATVAATRIAVLVASLDDIHESPRCVCRT